MDLKIEKICSICARGGSKGVKNKNIRELLGKPLIAHSIEQARSSKLFESVVVSSDSRTILDIARKWGADYLIERPTEMATDRADKLPAIQHCVQEVEKLTQKTFEVMVDLDATSPLRNIEDIIGSVRLLEDKKVSNVITGAPARRSPYFNLLEIDAKGVVRLSKPPHTSIVRRQDSPKCYDANASIYAWKRDAFFRNTEIMTDKTFLYVMPEERSIDIDSELDFEMVEFLMMKQKGLV